MLIPLLFCLLPRLGLSNLLHTGCRVQNFLKFSTFKDSVSFHMFLPSTLPSKVVVEQGNKTTSLLVNDTMRE
ncbi:hypothetical protein O3P69_005153 [Scylla paramamosain]|uniref:Secreted protein n=1 Tax=Scylla paramamosain TaxID=85552 RepID=A0AAW0UFE7_SCYPA